MALLRIACTKRTSDEEGRLVEYYTVESDGEENIETVLNAYTRDNQRLPRKGEVNILRETSGNTKLTYVDTIKISHEGKDWNTYKVTVNYLPPEESRDKDDTNSDIADYPWNELTEYSQSADIILEAARGRDGKDQPYQYSNGAPMVKEVGYPITNISLIRRPLVSKRNSFELSSEFQQVVNQSTVTLKGTVYPPLTLLVQSFNVNLVRFKETDANTGNVTITEYQEENIILSYNKRTWQEPVIDEGGSSLQKTFKSVDNAWQPDLALLPNVASEGDDKGKQYPDWQRLNGNGQMIGYLDPQNNNKVSATTSGITPQGVEISDEYSVGGDGPEAVTSLLMLDYEQKSFNPLKLNEGL